ncbi:MAG: hypothetical protein ACREDR_28600, partial [Blastocatellia bacterium]
MRRGRGFARESPKSRREFGSFVCGIVSTKPLAAARSPHTVRRYGIFCKTFYSQKPRPQEMGEPLYNRPQS